MNIQQSINRELYALMTVVKDDIRAAVTNFVKADAGLSQESAVMLINLLQSSVDATMIKVHPHFDKKLQSLLSSTKI